MSGRSIKEFLQNRPIYYKKIDYERFPRAYAAIKDKIPLKNVIQIIGTNGKGSTGRFLANAIAAAGFSVGHYTSPHVFKLNERIYLGGRIAQSPVFALNSGASNFKNEQNSASASNFTEKQNSAKMQNFANRENSASQISISNLQNSATQNLHSEQNSALQSFVSTTRNFCSEHNFIARNSIDTQNYASTQNLWNSQDLKSPSEQNFKSAQSSLPISLGRDATDEELDFAHEFLQESLPAEFKDSLSYFEYLTLAAAVIFKDCDYCVIEAGMGGEFDATSSFGRTLSLFTPIGTDHLGMLGQNLEQIAHTKLITMDKEAILSDEMSEVPLRIAQQIAEQKGTHLRFATELLSKSEQAQIAEFCAHNNLPKFQISNLALALAAMKFLNLKFEISQLPPLNLRGRMEVLAPNLRVDVGHNELAAQQVAREITEIYGGKKIVLIYNAFADKDVAAVLRTLAPVVERVEIFNYEVADREMAAEAITRALDALKIPHSPFRGELRADEEYLVFGSFHLVENFILWLEARRG
ncbi:bifunctional folypolyglutamate synthetase / dihydrofolate synthetase [Campylobacter gracilis]|uniref:Bifunctional protein FolC n=1 Tax=Campylobacter gracilis RM3268 TaxID=553220 RepID=C8PJX3_9BACT|nr:bifunctional folypolyglutamate synthetase / dihydrofolate synthetase [Campylobacter gracilis]EEV17228.1 bifunctional protein FolC [Campylobacter gracilis RM3268]SUW81690.1 folylpolyglutamate synthase [Campylobacter gracilis]